MDVLALRDQLRRERQAVAADKQEISRLSAVVEDLSHRVLCEAWKDRQQWRNIDLLMKTRVSASQCARRIQLIEKVNFLKQKLPFAAPIIPGAVPKPSPRSSRKGSRHHGAKIELTQELSEFFTLLMRHPEILARVLIYADSCKLDSGPLVEIALASVYGNYVLPEDEISVLQLLDHLLGTQLPACRQPRLFFRGVACAFTRMLSLFCEGLFSAKAYLCEALHDCVKQLLLDDERLFEFEPAKLCTRLSAEERASLFDEDMRPLPDSERVWCDLDIASAKVSSYSMLVLTRLVQHLHCMPIGLRWLAARLKMHLLQLRVVQSQEEIAPLLSDLLFGCFISPALAMPEAAIVAVDTTVSENARYNLTQVARILQGAANAALTIKRGQELAPHLQTVYSKIDLNMFAEFFDRISEGVDVNSPPPVPDISGLQRSHAYVTDDELAVVSGADQIIEERDSRGNTPLHTAAASGNVGCVREMLFYLTAKQATLTNHSGVTAASISSNNTPSDKIHMLTYFQKARLPLSSRGLPQRLVPLLDILLEGEEGADYDTSVRKQSADGPSATLSALAGDDRRRSTSTMSLAPGKASKERESFTQSTRSRRAQSKTSVPGAMPPPSPNSRRLQRLRSGHTRPPTEVYVVPLQAAKPCGHVDLLSVQQVIKQTAPAQRPQQYQSPVTSPVTRGTATSAESTSHSSAERVTGPANLPSNTTATVTAAESPGFLSRSSRTGTPEPDQATTNSLPAAPGTEKLSVTSTAQSPEDSVAAREAANTSVEELSTLEGLSLSRDDTPAENDGESVVHDQTDNAEHVIDGKQEQRQSATTTSPAPCPRSSSHLGIADSSSQTSLVSRTARSGSVCESTPVSEHPLMSSPTTDPEPSSGTSSSTDVGLGSQNGIDHTPVHVIKSLAPNSTVSASSAEAGCSVSSEHADTMSQSHATGAPPSSSDAQGLSLSLEQPTHHRSSAAAAAATDQVRNFTVSDSYRDYHIISSPEEAAREVAMLNGGDDDGNGGVLPSSLWQRMAESQWSLGSMVKRGIVDAETGVSKLAIKTWENIAKTATLSGNLLRRMSINASTEMLRARREQHHGHHSLHDQQRGEGGGADAWMTDAQRDRYAAITADAAWESVSLFNVLRWRLRSLLAQSSKTDSSNYISRPPRPPATDRATSPSKSLSPSGSSTALGDTAASTTTAGLSRSGPLFSFAGHTYALFDLIPDCANPQVTELFRCLTQQLHSARYMTDGDECTTLHDTINLLKHLPERGITYLITVLDRDYRDRAHYHAYLYRVKQSLQVMETCLNSMLHHIERHQHCSLQFFMATCVRLFLERQATALEQFVVNFEQAAKPQDKAAIVESFLSAIYSLMDDDPLWAASQDQMYSGAQLAVERACFARVYRMAFRPNGALDVEADGELSKRIDCLARVVTVRHRALQIPEKYCQQAPWPGAVEALSHLGLYKTPYDKLAVVHACCRSIMRSLAFPLMPDSASPVTFAFPDDDESLDGQLPGADDFFPVFVYVILSTNPPALVSTVNFVNTFQGNRLFGEVSYCWTQFCTALEFIKMIEL